MLQVNMMFISYTLTLLQEDELKNTILLVLANKQDLPDALSPTNISETLQLTEIKNRSWFIQKSSAITGEGLDLGFDWYKLIGDERCNFIRFVFQACECYKRIIKTF